MLLRACPESSYAFAETEHHWPVIEQVKHASFMSRTSAVSLVFNGSKKFRRIAKYCNWLNPSLLTGRVSENAGKKRMLRDVSIINAASIEKGNTCNGNRCVLSSLVTRRISTSQEAMSISSASNKSFHPFCAARRLGTLAPSSSKKLRRKGDDRRIRS